MNGIYHLQLVTDYIWNSVTNLNPIFHRDALRLKDVSIDCRDNINIKDNNLNILLV